MPVKLLSVAERIAILKNIFATLGIPVFANSALEHTIVNEFGPGKRSAVNQLIADLSDTSDASRLAICIGKELQKHRSDPQLQAIATVMTQRLPDILQIVDVQNHSIKREQILAKILDHFAGKIKHKQGDNARLLAMLNSSRAILQQNSQVHAVAGVLESSGRVLQFSELSSFGKVLHKLGPALIAIDHSEVPLEQKLNHINESLAVLAATLNNTKLTKAAQLVDNLHWLGRVTWQPISDKSCVEQALQNLGINLGAMTILSLEQQALKQGVKKSELAQAIYAVKEQALIDDTQRNRQFAAACGLVGKLGQDLQLRELEQIGVTGLCVMSMRQIYCELKASKLTAASFSEGLGLIINSIGILSNNPTLTRLGSCINAGVLVYAGAIVSPGGAALAVPLAVCTVLSKMLITRPRVVKPVQNQESLIYRYLDQILAYQREIRVFLGALKRELSLQIDQRFADLAHLVQTQRFEQQQALAKLDIGVNCLQFNLGQRFNELYLEDIAKPLQEIEFALRYQQFDAQQLIAHKQRLCLWLLYKSRDRKVNGRDLLLDPENIAIALQKISDPAAVLGLLNHYLNLEFAQSLPEDLPHMPTWLLAARWYVELLANYSEVLQLQASEQNIIQDIMAVAAHVSVYLQQLAQVTLLERLQAAIVVLSEDLELKKAAILRQNIPESCVLNLQAHPAALELQLEKFTAFNLDIRDIWREHLEPKLPVEFLQAHQAGLGSIKFEFAVDKDFNTFYQAQLDYEHEDFPSADRHVIFRVDVFFLVKDQPQKHSLISAWFAYTLCSAKQRFEEYYLPKFLGPLRHRRYQWISLDGNWNKVVGHPITATQKPIDYQKLAEVYKAWWNKSQPVSVVEIFAAIAHKFTPCNFLFINTDTILHLQIELMRALSENQHRLKMQCEIAMQADPSLRALQKKLANYRALHAAIQKILVAKPSENTLQSSLDTANLQLRLLLNSVILPRFNPQPDY